jgi:hypothetical protein
LRAADDGQLRSRIEHDLDATILLGSEDVVAVRSFTRLTAIASPLAGSFNRTTSSVQISR